MGRGSSDQRQLSQQQLGIYNNWITGERANREGDSAMLTPMISDLANSEGYDPSEKTAITGRAMEGLDTGYDVGNQQARAASARTRNSAGLFGSLTRSAQDRAAAKSDTARGLEQTFADEKQRRRIMGTQLMAQKYGIDTNLLGGIAGLPNGSLNANAAGISHGVNLGPFGNWG